jgi:hypothetical protein
MTPNGGQINSPIISMPRYFSFCLVSFFFLVVATANEIQQGFAYSHSFTTRPLQNHAKAMKNKATELSNLGQISIEMPSSGGSAVGTLTTPGNGEGDAKPEVSQGSKHLHQNTCTYLHQCAYTRRAHTTPHHTHTQTHTQTNAHTHSHMNANKRVFPCAYMHVRDFRIQR